MMERSWTEVSEEYTGTVEDRIKVAAAIDRLTWHDVVENMTLPFSPAQGIKAAITELKIPQPTRLAWNGYLEWPDGPETATYSVYGIDTLYTNGRALIFLLDTGTAIIPLCTDFDEAVVA